MTLMERPQRILPQSISNKIHVSSKCSRLNGLSCMIRVYKAFSCGTFLSRAWGLLDGVMLSCPLELRLHHLASLVGVSCRPMKSCLTPTNASCTMQMWQLRPAEAPPGPPASPSMTTASPLMTTTSPRSPGRGPRDSQMALARHARHISRITMRRCALGLITNYAEEPREWMQNARLQQVQAFVDIWQLPGHPGPGAPKQDCRNGAESFANFPLLPALSQLLADAAGKNNDLIAFLKAPGGF